MSPCTHALLPLILVGYFVWEVMNGENMQQDWAPSTEQSRVRGNTDTFTHMRKHTHIHTLIKTHTPRQRCKRTLESPEEPGCIRWSETKSCSLLCSAGKERRETGREGGVGDTPSSTLIYRPSKTKRGLMNWKLYYPQEDMGINTTETGGENCTEKPGKACRHWSVNEMGNMNCLKCTQMRENGKGRKTSWRLFFRI